MAYHGRSNRLTGRVIVTAKAKRQSVRLKGMSAEMLAAELERASEDPDRKRGAGRARAIMVEQARVLSLPAGLRPEDERSYRAGRAGEWPGHPQDREPSQRPDRVWSLLLRRLGHRRCLVLFGYADNAAWATELGQRVNIAGDRKRELDRIARDEARAWTRRLARRVIEEKLPSETGYWTAAGRLAAEVLAGWRELPGWMEPEADPEDGRAFLDQLHEAIEYGTRPHRTGVKDVPASISLAPHPEGCSFQEKVASLAMEEIAKREAR